MGSSPPCDSNSSNAISLYDSDLLYAGCVITLDTLIGLIEESVKFEPPRRTTDGARLHIEMIKKNTILNVCYIYAITFKKLPIQFCTMGSR